MQTIDSINDSDNSSHTVITGTIQISLYVFKNPEPFFFYCFSHINEDKRKTEGQVQMFEILRDVDGCPVSPW